MRCHFIIPYAVWPRPEESARIMQDLHLPKYALLAGRGRRTSFPALPTRNWFAQSLGWTTLPAAALLLSAAGAEDAAGNWLCLDPIHLTISQRGAEMGDPAQLDITAEEAQQLITALNQQFSDDGLHFRALSPERWVLKLAEPVRAAFNPIDTVFGRNVGDFLPSGEGAAYWHRLINEIQMLLYAHPVNDARAARHQLLINSVWPWGAAAYPLPPALNTPAGLLHGNDSMLAAMIEHAGGMCVPCPSGMDGLNGSHATVVLDDLLRPAQWQDAASWREAWLSLERNWFVPAHELLADGQLKELHIISPEAGMRIELQRSDLWRIWRRPRLPCT